MFGLPVEARWMGPYFSSYNFCASEQTVFFALQTHPVEKGTRPRRRPWPPMAHGGRIHNNG